MTIQSVLLPVFVEVCLIYALALMMAVTRADAMRKGLVNEADVALSGDVFPPRARQFASCYANQFEIPVLFFVAVLLAIQVRQAGIAFVIVEWIFVASRLAQAFVHVTCNNLKFRGPFFIVSAVATAILWALIADGIFMGVP